METLRQVQSRQKDIEKLERSIRELADVFQYMYALVEQQGEKIDRVEKYVNEARDYVENALAATDKAVKYRNKALKVSFSLRNIAFLKPLLSFRKKFAVGQLLFWFSWH